MRGKAVLIVVFLTIMSMVNIGLIRSLWFRPTKASRLQVGGIILSSGVKTLEVNTPLETKLFNIRWVAYAPTNFNPTAVPPILPSDASMRVDLEVLKATGFSGLVTYGAHLVSIPRIAKEVGFQGLLLGVWDPTDAQEILKAERAAQQDIVLGIIVGNEGLMFHRYDLPALQKAMEELKRATGKPVATTEVIESYMTRSSLIKWSDFLAPNVHPFHHSIKTPRRAVAWTVKSFQNLVKRAHGKPVLFKEVGFPTAGDKGLSEALQAQYYALLRETAVQFVYFEAFDGPWKPGGAIETHWGLFRADRTPKLAGRVVAGRESITLPSE